MPRAGQPPRSLRPPRDAEPATAWPPRARAPRRLARAPWRLAAALLLALAVVLSGLGAGPGGGRALAQGSQAAGAAGEAAEAAGDAAQALVPESPSGPHFTPPRPPQAATPQAVEADQGSIDARLEAWADTAHDAESALADGSVSTAEFEAMRARLVRQRDEAASTAERLRAAHQPLAAQLEALGEGATEGGASPRAEAGLSELRHELQDRIDALESRAKRADLAYSRADSLVREIDELIRRRQVEEFLTLGPSPLAPTTWGPALSDTLGLLASLGQETLEVAQARVDRGSSRLLPTALILLAVSAALLLGASRAFTVIRRRLGFGATRGRRALAAALALCARLVAPTLAIVLLRGALAQAELLGPRAEVLADHLASGLVAVAIGFAIAGAWFSPRTPELRLSSLDDAAALRGFARSTLLALTFGLHVSLVEAGASLDLSPAALAVGNLAVMALGAAAMWRLADVLSPGPEAPAAAPAPASEDEEPGDPRPDEDPLAESLQSAATVGRRLERLGAFSLRAVAVVSVALAAAGYYAASQRLFFPAAATAAIVGAGLILFSLIREWVEAALENRTADSGGLRLLTVFFGFVIVIASLPVLALVWGARTADIGEAWRMASAGVEVGGTILTPMVFVTFGLVFAFGYALTRLLQGVMASSVLPNTRLDAGARSAITTGLGWTGITAAALVGIAAAGLDLSNIAIVFGALSVGIGFGLQAIASNFISGIILMIERPVKVGDWILVGGTHGVVKRVAVRATEIETFDKTALIVPNSELISGRVVNYTHNNAVGRLILKAPVAYGTDLKGVQKLLLDIARKDRRVLRYPAPMVLMTGFGQAAIELELRVILRDVNQIFDVQTDLFFEIDRRYREAGIEIPYSQNIVTLRDPERLAAAFRGAPPPTDQGLAVPDPSQAAETPPPAPAPSRRRAAPPPAPKGPAGPGIGAGIAPDIAPGAGGDADGGGGGDGGR
ncbi:DUF3772 domain-containing protein [Albimonas pacifica]|uniref:Small-conductance mechanosensitive channel n=1 Tax=Albimonas pacifica TaxID=1114924 RepID=A0A1I3LNV5_9RHOB|nr:DUF3772 domain-containing protein [Albimonas pacifica]SFI86459.1 Small-conductance mechanosensitive channel [Albimonas pacifica]